jgi:hypothetical protein
LGSFRGRVEKEKQKKTQIKKMKKKTKQINTINGKKSRKTRPGTFRPSSEEQLKKCSDEEKAM